MGQRPIPMLRRSQNGPMGTLFGLRKKNCFAAGQNLGLQKRPPKTDPKRKNCFVSSAQYQRFGAPKMGRWAPFLASEKKNCFAAGQNLGLQKRPPKSDPKRKNCFVSSAQYQCFG